MHTLLLFSALHKPFGTFTTHPARLVFLQGGEATGAAERMIKTMGKGALEGAVESGDVTINSLREQHRQMVEASLRRKVMNKHDAKSALQWSAGETDAKKLISGIERFSKDEKFLLDQSKEFRKQIKEQVSKHLFAPKSEESYMEWFRELTDQKKMEFLNNKKTDLHDKRREELLKIMDGSSGRKVYLPESIRKQYWKQFLNSDLEEREALVKYLEKEHTRLKSAFELLPVKVQEKYLEQFVKANLDNREQLLGKIGKEIGQEVVTGATEANEGRRLDRGWEQKLKDMVKNKLLSSHSAASYDIWFKKLPLDEKKTMLLEQKSELDTRLSEREKVRDEFYDLGKKQPDVLKKHEQRFLTLDLDRRKEMVQNLQNPEAAKAQQEEVSYTDQEIEEALNEAKRDPDLQETLLVTHLMETQYQLNDRARKKLGLGKTVDAEDVAAKAQEAGIKTREQSSKTKEALNRSDRRVNHSVSKTAVSRVEKMKQERQKALGQVDNTSRLSQALQEERAQGEKGTGTGQELVEKLEETHELDEETKAAAKETEFRSLHLGTLKLRRDARSEVKHDLSESREVLQNDNATIANMKYYDETGSKEITQDLFNQKIRQPQLEEARSRMIARMRRSLPGINETVLTERLKRPGAMAVNEQKVNA